MKFEYLDYKSDIFSETIEDHPPRVYVFKNHEDRCKAESRYHQPFLQKSSLFLTLSEFKDKLFPSEKLVLREQKLRVILYELLTDEEKDYLNISSYFDMADLGSNFFNFYDQLHEYKVNKLEGVREWQSDKLEIINDLRVRYLKFMRENGYTDNTIKFNFENFSLNYLRKYNQIYFINIVEFTPKEKELLNKVEKYGKKISLFLQLKQGDFDEENLNLKSVTLPKNLNTEIKFFHTSEDLLQLVNILNNLEEETMEVLDADFNNSNYNNLLSCGQVKVDKKISFTQTSIYKLIKRLYQLLSGAEIKEGKIRVEMEDLMRASRQQEFISFFDLSDRDISALNRLAKDDYVYFDRFLINQDLSSYIPILDTLYELYDIRDLDNLIDYLAELNIEGIMEEKYSDNHIQFFDALAELQTLVNLGLVSSWQKYFSPQALGLVHLVLDYLEYKNVKRVCGEIDPCLVFKDLFDAPQRSRNKLFIVNANNKALPSVRANQFLLTEKQRIDIGLPCVKSERIKQKYMFFRHILNSEQCIIFSLENIEENMTASSFVEELKIRYNLKSKEGKVDENSYPQIMQSIFAVSDNIELQSLRRGNRKKTPLLLEKSDFPDQGLSITFYKYRCLRDCYYLFYLKHLGGLEEEWIKFDLKLNKKVLGIIVHEMFEDIIKELKGNIKQGKLKPDKGVISNIISHKVKYYDLKIPNYFYSYYENILIPRISDSIKEFFNILERKIESEIIDVFTEWSHNRKNYFLEEEKTSFYLKGRIDLIIKTKSKIHLIDFKTGGGNKKQLDFYSLLIEPELEGAVDVEKFFYSVIDQKIKQRYRSSEKFKQKLADQLEDFISQDQYTAVYKSSCRNCQYNDICRVVVK